MNVDSFPSFLIPQMHQHMAVFRSLPPPPLANIHMEFSSWKSRLHPLRRDPQHGCDQDGYASVSAGYKRVGFSDGSDRDFHRLRHPRCGSEGREETGGVEKERGRARHREEPGRTVETPMPCHKGTPTKNGRALTLNGHTHRKLLFIILCCSLIQ